MTETEYILYERMFKGIPQGIAIDFTSGKYQELAFIIANFHGLTEDAEEMLAKLKKGTETIYDDLADTVKINGDSAVIMTGDEIQAEISKKDLEDILEEYIQRCRESEKDGNTLSKIKPMREILAGLEDMAENRSLKLSYPVFTESNGEYELCTMFIEIDNEAKATGLIKKPSMWGISDISGTDMKIDGALNPNNDPERIPFRKEGIEYNENYQSSLLDEFDSVRYDLITKGRFNTALYMDYLDQLLDMIPDELGRFLREKSDLTLTVETEDKNNCQEKDDIPEKQDIEEEAPYQETEEGEQKEDEGPSEESSSDSEAEDVPEQVSEEAEENELSESASNEEILNREAEERQEDLEQDAEQPVEEKKSFFSKLFG